MGQMTLVAIFLLINSLNFILTTADDVPADRQRRSLVFPEPSMLILIFGLGTPLQLQHESVIIGMFAKMQYKLPSNASAYEMVHQREQQQQPESRWRLYRRLSRLAELYGFAKSMDGRACVLRAICEVASTPFEPTHGLLHQLLNLFFTPSSTGPEPYEEYEDREYEAVEELGTQVPRACQANFQRECPVSLLDIFTSLP